jgi:hypothetical protein
MNPGFRYHVTTLAAIFLALGVGIMIGSSFVQSQIVERQTARLEELGNQFNREIGPLRDANSSYARFLEQTASTLTDNKLAGIRVALVQTGDYPETIRIVREALESAGAQVESETVIHTQIQKPIPDAIAEIAKSLPGDGAPERLMSMLARGLAAAGHKEDLDALAKAGLIDMSGDYSRPVSFVVLVGGATEKEGSRSDKVDLPLALALKPLINTVIAVEPLEAEISYIETIRAAGIPTVDNADTDIGRIAVIMAIQGPAGDYGVKVTARSGIVPPPASR